LCENDKRLLIKGRVSVEEERGAKLICQKMVSLDEIPMELWVRFDDMEAFNQHEADLKAITGAYDGKDILVAFCAKEKMVKKYSQSMQTDSCPELIEKLKDKFGEESVAVMAVRYDWPRF